jgi:large subunit ribosomal protein L7/L12
MTNNIKVLAEQLVNMSVKDVNELAKILKEDYGIEPEKIAAHVMPNVAVDGNVAVAAVAEKTIFDVVLKSSGPKKLEIIKLVKEKVGLGLKESKELVDEAPKTLKEKLNKADAEALYKAFKDAGAEVEMV